MNLTQYEQVAKDAGEFISFKAHGESKIIRFLYESGGVAMGEDIILRKKFWDETTKKYIMDDPRGSYSAVLKVALYTPKADGTFDVTVAKWDRSGAFIRDVLLPAWRNYPKISEGVWKVTASNPGTKTAAYSLFPIIDANVIKYPLPESTAPAAEDPVKAAHESANNADDEAPFDVDQPAAQASTPSASPAGAKKKYWE